MDMLNIRLLSLFNFFTDFVFFAPVAIIYFARVTGSYTLGMSIFSVAYVSSAVLEVPTGIFSDLIGRRKTAILGAMSSVVCIILYAVGDSYWILFTGAIFQGLSRAFYSGNNDALLHDTLREFCRENEYHSYYGRATSMFQIALAAASLIGGILASWSFFIVMWASVIPQLIALIVAFQFKEPKKPPAKSMDVYMHFTDSLIQFRKNYRLRFLSFASVLRFSLGEAGFFLRSAFINSLWPLWAVGFSYMFSHIGAAVSFYFGGKAIDKYGPYKVLNIEIVLNRIINIIALIFPTIISPLLMSGTSWTYGLGSVSLNSLLQKEFTKRQRATMGSINSLAGSIAFGLFSITLGLISDKLGLTFALLLTQILLLAPLFFYWKALKTKA